MRKIFGVLAIALTLLSGQLYSIDAIASSEGKTLKIGVTQEFDSLNPIHSRMLVSRYVYNFTNRTLVTLDMNSRWVPLIVKQIPTMENGGARFVTENGVRKVVTDWEIKKEFVWGDGTPVTGDDVAFSREVVLNKFTTTGNRKVYDQIEAVIVDPKNKKKFTLKYKAANYDYQ